MRRSGILAESIRFEAEYNKAYIDPYDDPFDEAYGQRDDDAPTQDPDEDH